ncbi:hypothetical protein MMC10_008837 [Thelotrema lepadinum]|nr:hypothetical protein [Thelotrema lepadinum]
MGKVTLIKADITSSPPFQLLIPSLPDLRKAGTVTRSGEEISETTESSSAISTTSPSRSSSPNLPPLPRLSKSVLLPSAQISSPTQQKSDSTYYTALWGSPYDLPSSSRASPGNKASRRRNSVLTTDGSPLRKASSVARDSGYQDPRPGRFFRRSNTTDQFSSSSFRDSGRTPVSQRAYDLTGDWIRNYKQERIEKRTWLSDESDDSGGSSESESDSPNEGLKKEDVEFDPKTPRASQLNRQALKIKPANLTGNSIQKTRRTHLSSETLTQQDFDSLLKGKPERSDNQATKMLSAMMSGIMPKQDRRSDSISEKPLPAAPLNRTASDSPVITMQGASADRPNLPKRPSISSMASFQHPKRKFVWRGKNTTVAMPLDVSRGADGMPKLPLQPDEVTARMRRWEDEGFSNRGFDLGDNSSGVASMSREVYPDTSEYHSEVQSRQFRVRIPNRKAFDDLIKERNEEILRALGVTKSDEPVAEVSPGVSASMSRQASSQNSFVPSLSSGLSGPNPLRTHIEGTFSPPLTAPNPQFPFTQPLISPNAMPQNPRSAGFHSNQTMPFQAGQIPKPIGPFSPHQLGAPPGHLAQPQHLGSVPSSRGVSPLIDGRRQSIVVSNSPVSPLPDMGDGYFNHLAQLPPHVRQQVGQAHPALMQQAVQQQKPSMQRQVSNTLRPQQPMRFVSQPDIASPLPQGHRHNLSETLQKEIDEAEHHLEESIARQLEDKDEEEPASKSKNDGDSDSATEKEESIVGEEPLEIKTGGPDVETNPSLGNSPMPKSAEFPPLSAQTPKTANSKLNVNAQEFKFDPSKASFAPMFAFGDQSSTLSGPPSARSVSETGAPHSKTVSNASTFSSGLNVTAPAFVPGKVQVQPSATPNRVFSFSSSLSGTKPSGLSSTPGYAFNSTTPDDSEKKAQAPRIFSDIVPPVKKSKAVPIIPPKEEQEDDEDESGRVARTKGREKRMRREDGEGDQVPLFAEMPIVPSMPLTREDETEARDEDGNKEEQLTEPVLASTEESEEIEERQSPKPKIPAIVSPEPTALISPAEKTDDGPLNTADFLDAPTNPSSPKSPINKATDELKAMVDDIMVPEDVKPHEIPRVQGPIEDPFAVGDHEDDGVTDKSRPHSRAVSPRPAFVDEKLHTIPNGTALAPRGNSASEIVSPKPSLSTSAKSFTFNPTVSAFRPPEPSVETVRNTPVPAAEPVKQAPIMKPMIGGLEASRYATEEPTQMPREPTPPAPMPILDKLVSPVEEPSNESRPNVTEEEETRRSDWDLSSEISPRATFPMTSRSDSPKASLDERIMNGVQYVEPPSYQELDEVMRQLNHDSDAGVERNPAAAWRSPVRRATDEHKYDASERPVAREYMSDADRRMLRSPVRVTASPNRLKQPFQYLPSQDYGSTDSEARSALAEIAQREARYSPSFKKPRRPSVSIDSPIRKLNRNSDRSPSVWDDIVSSGEEDAFNARVGFFDNRVSHVVANAIDGRLQPLESSLAALTAELARKSDRSRSRRYQRSASRDVENSDADDEDDETVPGRTISPFMKDRKFEKLKTLLLEAVNNQRPPPTEDTSKVLETLAEVKSALNRQQQEPETKKDEAGHEAIAKVSEAIAELKSSLASQPPPLVAPISLSNEEMANMTKAVAQLQASMDQHKSRPGSPHDIKAVIEDAIHKHMRGKSMPVKTSQESAAVEKLNLQVSGLESMLKIQETRADDEYKLRRQVEDRLADSQRELKNALAEATQNRDIAEETESSLRSFLEDQQRNKQHMATLEEVHDAMEKNVSDLAEKNNALEETISEYRISHDDWRSEIDEAKAHNDDLQRTISSLREELEDGIKSKHLLRGKFDRIQEEMSETARKIAGDQASWRHKDEEHKAKHEMSSARLEAEARTRERLELEIERLESQEKESMKARFMVEQVRNENNNLSALANDLRNKSHQHQEQAMAHERELHDTKERSHLEIERITALTGGDVEAANQKVEIVKSKLEGSIARLETQLDNTKKDADLAKERYEIMLEEASASRDTALREAAEAREAALQEHYRFHERTLDETRSSHDRAMSELQDSHKRALGNTTEDHHRAIGQLVHDHERVLNTATEERRIREHDLTTRLELSNEKTLHLQDLVKSLEERLDITKSAAQAAAEAARSARSSTPQPQPSTQSASRSGMPSMPITRDSQIPDKISPQALRESILVLQEQLHERESRIETLSHQLSQIDHSAPQKIKDRDIEITWLRELLGVRLDDLQDIIISLSSPSFDQNTVRDAAIRLRANLQMEQQEKERSMVPGARGQISSLSSLAASPARSFPMAAAAAWGNFRKAQGSLSSLAEMAVPSSVTSSVNQTPSRASPQSFLSGLLTPPNTNVRHTPQARGPGVGASSASRPTSSSARRPLGGYSTPKRQMSSSGNYDGRRPLAQGGGLGPPPESPSLLRTGSYDADAQEGNHHYSLEAYGEEPQVEEEEGEGGELRGSIFDKGKGKKVEDEGGRGKVVRERGMEELFGPSIELES